MSHIAAIGSNIETTSTGKFINPCSIENIATPWSDVIGELLKAYQDNLKERLHSVYVRGSVARGTAVPNVSDIDTFAVIDGATDQIDLSWVDDVERQMLVKYPFHSGVEMQFVSEDEIFESTNAGSIRFTIKVLSVCIWGKDISSVLPDFKHGPYLMQEAAKVEHHVEGALSALSSSTDEEQVEQICRWIMKIIVRAGLFVVMDKEQAYSRDLYPCYIAFSKHYAEDKKKQMEAAFKWVLEPSGDKKLIEAYLLGFGKWLTGEITQKIANR